MRALIVDLNNFAMYPTVAVGYLAAILRRAGHEVAVFSPLTTGVTGVVREAPVKPWGLIDQRLRYWSAVSTSPLVRRVRANLAARHGPKLARQTDRVFADFQRCLNDDRSKPFDVVLISTYLLYHDLCARICGACKAGNIPVIIGGAYFSQPEVVDQWIDIDGLTALVTGEAELELASLALAAVERRPLDSFASVVVPGNGQFKPAPPMVDLDSVPFPDYVDFPWQRYPNRIVPMITGRGCGWGACTFCSDVTSSAGRTFRSRSPENVAAEIGHQTRRHEANLFVFTDLKLNSNLSVWEALISEFQSIVPGGRWIGSVHVGSTGPNGLGRDELKAARAAGMVRLTTGLESGSQRMLDSMAKGTDLAVTSRFLHDARDAGISVRTTMILGYPGEQAPDVDLSARFLEDHGDCIERVSLNRFLIMTGTRIHRRVEKNPQALHGVTQLTINHRLAQVGHSYEPGRSRAYRESVTRLLRAVHAINRRPLSPAARVFEGVM